MVTTVHRPTVRQSTIPLTFPLMTNTFGARSTLKVGGRTFEIFRLDALTRAGIDV
jgi:hypothetical protein